MHKRKRRFEGPIVLGSLLFAGAILTTCSMALAQPHRVHSGDSDDTIPPEVTYRSALPRDPQGAAGVVVHTNQISHLDSRLIALDTPFGSLTLHLTVTPNRDCAQPCPDTLEVIEVPPGMAAVPLLVTTPERNTSEIVIFPALGF